MGILYGETKETLSKMKNTMRDKIHYTRQPNELAHGYFKTMWFEGNFINGKLSGLIIYRILKEKVYYA